MCFVHSLISIHNSYVWYYLNNTQLFTPENENVIFLRVDTCNVHVRV